MEKEKEQVDSLHISHYHFIADLQRRKDGCIDAFSSLSGCSSHKVLATENSLVDFAMEHALSINQLDDMMGMFHGEQDQSAWL